MQLERFEAEALMRVRNDPGLAPFKTLLKKRLERARDECTGLAGEMLMRAQGRAQELKQQLDLIESAPGLLEKLMNEASRSPQTMGLQPGNGAALGVGPKGRR